ncbi:MAG: anti-sigma factor RsbA family regulatory protein [Acidimicrobiales bacterium]
MRSGISAGHVGHFHEAGFYASDAEFRTMIMPFVEEGLAAGEPVVLSFDQRKVDLLRGWLGNPVAVTLQAADGSDGMYANPARAIESARMLFERHVAAGAEQIRIAGEAPHAGNGGRFDGWDRYESAVNAVWGTFPVRSICLYDATTVPATVRDVVGRTHPWLLSPDGEHHPNARYEDPSRFVPLPTVVDPLETTLPLIELDGPAPARARRAVERAARGRVGDDQTEDLRLAVSEAVGNAHRHGVPPTTVRIWAADDRVVVRVHDGGQGPTDPFAGLVPASTTHGAGLGLWIAHQLALDVALIQAPDGFTMRLRAGQLPAAAA